MSWASRLWPRRYLRLTRAPPSAGVRASASRAAREFPGLGGDLHLLALLDEEGHADLDAGLHGGLLLDAAGGRVPAVAGLGVGDGELHLVGELEADGVPI